MSAPDIHGYLDYRAYLKDWFEARQASEPGFSRRSFSRLAGKTSPGLLTDILNGRRLNKKMIGAIASGIGLNRSETDFFDALVTLEQSRSSKERNDAWERISATRGFQHARRIDGAAFKYLSAWFIPVVRELSQRHDFQLDPAWIAARIRPEITEAQARQALEVLRDLGMIVDGRPADAVVTTPHEVQGLAVHNYHRGMLERAIDAIETAEPDERHYLAATVSVPHRAVAELKHELEGLQERILDLCGRFEGDAEEVLQVHLLLFPLSDRAEAK